MNPTEAKNIGAYLLSRIDDAYMTGVTKYSNEPWLDEAVSQAVVFIGKTPIQYVTHDFGVPRGTGIERLLIFTEYQMIDVTVDGKRAPGAGVNKTVRTRAVSLTNLRDLHLASVSNVFKDEFERWPQIQIAELFFDSGSVPVPLVGAPSDANRFEATDMLMTLMRKFRLDK
jgi:hypothetical protein